MTERFKPTHYVCGNVFTTTDTWWRHHVILSHGALASARRRPPDGLSSRSLRYFGAEVDHLDLEDLWDVRQFSESHRSPQQLEGDDHGYVLKHTPIQRVMFLLKVALERVNTKQHILPVWVTSGCESCRCNRWRSRVFLSRQSSWVRRVPNLNTSNT